MANGTSTGGAAKGLAQQESQPLRKVVQHEENIKRLTDEFVAGNRTLESFLTSISFAFD